MNYVTNYYKNLSEQLSQRVNHLQNLIEEITTKGTFTGNKDGGKESPMSSGMMYRSEKAPPPPPPPAGRQPMQGDGLAPGYEKPHKQGPKSKEWREWVEKNGHWHSNNPHKFGTPAWYQWEWEYYEVPPV
jgi:hypothetical protein